MVAAMSDWTGPPHKWIAIAITAGGGIAPFAILSYLKDHHLVVPYPWDVTLMASIILPTTICGVWIYIAGEIRSLKKK